MRTDTLLVADIEAVKDKRVLEDWPENKWPPPVCWRVLAIGMLVAHQEMTAKGLTTYVQKSGCITGPEDEIIPKFWQFFDKRQPVLVTWNGRGYDLPVLRQRAFVSAVPTSGGFRLEPDTKAIRTGIRPIGIAT